MGEYRFIKLQNFKKKISFLLSFFLAGCSIIGTGGKRSENAIRPSSADSDSNAFQVFKLLPKSSVNPSEEITKLAASGPIENPNQYLASNCGNNPEERLIWGEVQLNGKMKFDISDLRDDEGNPISIEEIQDKLNKEDYVNLRDLRFPVLPYVEFCAPREENSGVAGGKNPIRLFGVFRDQRFSNGENQFFPLAESSSASNDGKELNIEFLSIMGDLTSSDFWKEIQDMTITIDDKKLVLLPEDQTFIQRFQIFLPSIPQNPQLVNGKADVKVASLSGATLADLYFTGLHGSVNGDLQGELTLNQIDPNAVPVQPKRDISKNLTNGEITAGTSGPQTQNTEMDSEENFRENGVQTLPSNGGKNKNLEAAGTGTSGKTKSVGLKVENTKKSQRELRPDYYGTLEDLHKLPEANAYLKFHSYHETVSLKEVQQECSNAETVVLGLHKIPFNLHPDYGDDYGDSSSEMRDAIHGAIKNELGKASEVDQALMKFFKSVSIGDAKESLNKAVDNLNETGKTRDWLFFICYNKINDFYIAYHDLLEPVPTQKEKSAKEIRFQEIDAGKIRSIIPSESTPPWESLPQEGYIEASFNQSRVVMLEGDTLAVRALVAQNLPNMKLLHWLSIEKKYEFLLPKFEKINIFFQYTMAFDLNGTGPMEPNLINNIDFESLTIKTPELDENGRSIIENNQPRMYEITLKSEAPVDLQFAGILKDINLLGEPQDLEENVPVNWAWVKEEDPLIAQKD